MRFTLRSGTDPTATADRAMLAALGLPAGGVVSVGDSHVRVQPGKVPVATTMLIGPTALANAGLSAGVSADVKRVVLPAASTLVVDSLPADPRVFLAESNGLPVTPGDRLGDHTVRAVLPGPAGVIGPSVGGAVTSQP